MKEERLFRELKDKLSDFRAGKTGYFDVMDFIHDMVDNSFKEGKLMSIAVIKSCDTWGNNKFKEDIIERIKDCPPILEVEERDE